MARPYWFPETSVQKLPEPLNLKGDKIIVADAHAPTYSALWANRMLAVARNHKIKECVCIGDMLTVKWANHWDSEADKGKWSEEAQLMGAFWWTLIHSFEELTLLFSNHCRRVNRATNGRVDADTLINDIIMRFALENNYAIPPLRDRLTTSQFSYSYLDDDWLLCHPVQSSVNKLKVANDLSQRWRRNVIAAHSHAATLGYSRCGEFQIIDCGGLYDEDRMMWRQIDRTTAPAWKNGFVVYKNGFMTLCHPSMEWTPIDKMFEEEV